jgi:hypothetical protein
MTVFSTVSHVPHELPQLLAAPQELQLEPQGAEQHELALLPKQPACADAVIRTAAANDKTYRMSQKLLFESSDDSLNNDDPPRNTLEIQVSNCLVPAG